jgi:hypothetical protein
MAEPLAEPDKRSGRRVAWANEPQARPASRRRNGTWRTDDAGIDLCPFQGTSQRAELHRLVEGATQVLETTGAANTEKPTRRLDASRPRNQAFNDLAPTAPTASRAEPGAHPIARHGKGQEHWLALKLRNAVALCAQPFDQQFDSRAEIRRSVRH